MDLRSWLMVSAAAMCCAGETACEDRNPRTGDDPPADEQAELQALLHDEPLRRAIAASTPPAACTDE